MKNEKPRNKRSVTSAILKGKKSAPGDKRYPDIPFCPQACLFTVDCEQQQSSKTPVNGLSTKFTEELNII